MTDPSVRPDPSAALKWAVGAFRTYASPLLALAAVVTILQFLQLVASGPLQNITTDCVDPQTAGQVNACQDAVGSAIAPIGASLLFWFAALLATVGVQRAALRATQGGTPSFSDLLTTKNLARYLLFLLAYVVLVSVGLVLCILPGLLAAFFLQLGPYYVIDRGCGVREAMALSYRAIRANPGPALILLLFYGVALIIGSLFYGLPTLVTLPIVTLFTAHLYRQFNHEPVL